MENNHLKSNVTMTLSGNTKLVCSL